MSEFACRQCGKIIDVTSVTCGECCKVTPQPWAIERDRLQLQLDAVHGALTHQPGSDPVTDKEGWSPALLAAQTAVLDADRFRTEANAMAQKLLENLDGIVAVRKLCEEARDAIPASDVRYYAAGAAGLASDATCPVYGPLVQLCRDCREHWPRE